MSILTTERFIPYIITPEMRAAAKIDSDSYKDKLNNSIREGKGTLVGSLGEEIFAKVYPHAERINNYDYDFLLYGGTDRELTVDVKTKERTVPPRLHYECSVNTMNGKQKCDWYVFAQVLKGYKQGWLLGGVKALDYFEHSTYHLKGEIDASNGFAFRCNSYNMPISQLSPMRNRTPRKGDSQ